jgi:predicted nucleic acid-binding protein
MKAVIDTSYFIEFISSPFEKKFQWVSDTELITTTLFVYEVHNVLLKAVKVTPEDLYKYHDILHHLKIDFRDISGHEPDIYKLSFEHKLSFYDASYLWLSSDTKLPIATYDKEILRAANDLKINIFE